jgi:cytidyltransferase-like protein
MSVGLLFGTFDGLHEGHKAMLTEAKEKVDRLIISLALDEIVIELKGKAPRHSWGDRSRELIESGLVDEVIAGDRELGVYSSIASIRPEVIFIGYDQISLAADLKRFLSQLPTTNYVLPTIAILKPFKPDQFKSSLLNTV